MLLSYALSPSLPSPTRDVCIAAMQVYTTEAARNERIGGMVKSDGDAQHAMTVEDAEPASGEALLSVKIGKLWHFDAAPPPHTKTTFALVTLDLRVWAVSIDDADLYNDVFRTFKDLQRVKKNPMLGDKKLLAIKKQH